MDDTTKLIGRIYDLNEENDRLKGWLKYIEVNATEDREHNFARRALAGEAVPALLEKSVKQ